MSDGFADVDALFDALAASSDADDEGGLSILEHSLQCAALLRASHPDWAGRVEDHEMLCHDPSFADLAERTGATLIGFRELRDLQRAAT